MEGIGEVRGLGWLCSDFFDAFCVKVGCRECNGFAQGCEGLGSSGIEL